MKRVPWAVAALILVFILAWINHAAITKLDREIAGLIENSMTAASSGDFQEASLNLSQAQDTFLEWEGYFGAVVNHSELDSAVLSFARAFAILETRETNTYMEECSYLKKLFLHISDMESLSIRNIF